jgi:hypothetical protein
VLCSHSHRPALPQESKEFLFFPEARPTKSIKSVWTPDSKSSSIKDVFKVVTILQQIMTEFNGVESEEDRTMISKTCIKIREAEWILEFMAVMTVLANVNRYCKPETCPIVRESVTHQQIRNCQTVII